MLLDGRAEIVGGEAVLGIERAGADEDAVVEREDGSGLHLTRHGDEAEGGGGLRVKERQGCEEESNCGEKEPGCAAGGSRDGDHSVLDGFAVCGRPDSVTLLM
jgi:hypothetical protein